MSIDQVLRDIEKGIVAPFYFLYGPESFYRVEMLQALTQKLITPDNRDFNLENYDARESSPSDWIGAAKTLPFFGDIKLIIVRKLDEATLKDSDQKALLDYVARPSLGSCFVITADKVDRKRKLYKALTAQEGAVLCEAPEEMTLVPWVKKRAKLLGYELSSEVARKMVKRVGAKPGILAKELEKMITYAGKAKTITELIVGELVGEIKMESAFALTEALKEKSIEKALNLLKNQLDHGEDPIKILGLIAWQYRTLWEVKYHQTKKLGVREIAHKMGAKPFLVEKALKYTRNFNQVTLRNGMKSLFEADKEIKTSGKDSQGILETLLIKLCSS